MANCTHAENTFKEHAYHWWSNSYGIPEYIWIFICFPLHHFNCNNVLHAMGKLKTSSHGKKTRVVEAATIQTRRGPRLVNAPVESPQTPTSNSRNASPSKKRAWSPGLLQDNNKDELPSIQLPKRSRHSGKVRIVLHLFHVHSDEL